MAMPSLDKNKRIDLRDILRKKADERLAPQRDEPYAVLERVFVGDVLKDAYQRPLDEKRVRKIINEWDPLILGIPEVSRRSDGSIFVIDGQHRIVAISRMGSRVPQVVPMVVWYGLSPEEESQKFSKPQNAANRRAIIPDDIHNADLFAKDERAIAINDVVEMAGFRIGPSGEGRRIKAVKACYDIEGRYGPDMLLSVLSFVTAAWGTEMAPEGPLLAGVALFMGMYPDARYPSLIKRLARQPLDHWLIRADARGMALNIKTKRERVASALHAEYNTVHHQKPLADFKESMKRHSHELRAAAAREVRRRERERRERENE